MYSKLFIFFVFVTINGVFSNDQEHEDDDFFESKIGHEFERIKKKFESLERLSFVDHLDYVKDKKIVLQNEFDEFLIKIKDMEDADFFTNLLTDEIYEIIQEIDKEIEIVENGGDLDMPNQNKAIGRESVGDEGVHEHDHDFEDDENEPTHDEL